MLRHTDCILHLIRTLVSNLFVLGRRGIIVGCGIYSGIDIATDGFAQALEPIISAMLTTLSC